MSEPFLYDQGYFFKTNKSMITFYEKFPEHKQKIFVVTDKKAMFSAIFQADNDNILIDTEEWGWYDPKHEASDWFWMPLSEAYKLLNIVPHANTKKSTPCMAKAKKAPKE